MDGQAQLNIYSLPATEKMPVSKTLQVKSIIKQGGKSITMTIIKQGGNTMHITLDGTVHSKIR